jgi:hypothetical protein
MSILAMLTSNLPPRPCSVSGVALAYFLTSSAPCRVLLYLSTLLIADQYPVPVADGAPIPTRRVSATNATNVLYIMTDDMRPEVGGEGKG